MAEGQTSVPRGVAEAASTGGRGRAEPGRRASMECRKCGACCIALSVSSLGKPAGERCKHLTGDNLCALWGKPERPEVCSRYRPDPLFCGGGFEEALALMRAAEENG